MSVPAGAPSGARGAESEAGKPVSRLEGLDALRGVAMLLGVALHAAIPYLRVDVEFWPVRDGSRSAALDVLVYAVHSFRMPLFFLLGGLFAGLLMSRQGPGGLVRNRLWRLGVPLVLGYVTVVQLGNVFVALSVRAQAPVGEREGVVEAVSRFYVDALAGRTPHAALALWHLWFLRDLLLMALAAAGATALAAWAARRWRAVESGAAVGTRGASRAATALDGAGRVLVVSRWRVVLWALLLWPVYVLMPRWNIPTPGGVLPDPVVLAVHGAYFAAGLLMWRHRADGGGVVAGDSGEGAGRATPQRWGGLALIAAGLVILLPTMLALWVVKAQRMAVGGPVARQSAVVGAGAQGSPDFRPPAEMLTRGAAAPPGLHVAGAGVYALLGTVLVFGSVSAAVTWRPRPAWVWRGLAEASYWVYLAHIPLVMVVAWPMTAVGAPGVMKFAAVTVATTGLLLAAWWWPWGGVRATGLGRLLGARVLRPDRGTSGEGGGGVAG